MRVAQAGGQDVLGEFIVTGTYPDDGSGGTGPALPPVPEVKVKLTPPLRSGGGICTWGDGAGRRHVVWPDFWRIRRYLYRSWWALTRLLLRWLTFLGARGRSGRGSTGRVLQQPRRFRRCWCGWRAHARARRVDNHP